MEEEQAYKITVKIYSGPPPKGGPLFFDPGPIYLSPGEGNGEKAPSIFPQGEGNREDCSEDYLACFNYNVFSSEGAACL